MSKYPENITSFAPIELKLGIKSSLPYSKQAIALIYLLWKIDPSQAENAYSKEVADNLVPSDGILDTIKSFLTQNGIDLNYESLSEKTKQNPLYSSQIEHLNVAFELIWKISHFDFVANMPFSAERSGGKRYAKKILFTSNIDILDATIESNRNEYLHVIYNWLIGVDVEANQKKYEELLIRLLTCFSEDAYFQIRNNASNILFRNYEMYKAILSDSSAILDGEKPNNGPLRILCSSLKEGLNNYVVNVREDGKNVAKRNDSVSENIFSGYCSRVENLLKSSNRRIEELDEEKGACSEEQETAHHVPSQIIYYGVPGCGKSHRVDQDINNKLAEHNVADKEYHKVRCVFHPEYSNADFVGQVYPFVNPDGHGVDYRFKPGPFADVVRRAYHEPSKPFFLIIEEINRGNAAAIFGEMFQLLDRIKPGDGPDKSTENIYQSGWSSYGVSNTDVNAYIRQKTTDEEEIKAKRQKNESLIEIEINFQRDDCVHIVVDNGKREERTHELHFSWTTAIRLPPNLSIYATMNTSDQNVITMDNAFQRRFKSRMIRNDLKNAAQYNIKIEGTNVYWGAFRDWINDKILSTPGLSKADDKCLGGWFISTSVETKDDKGNVTKFKDIKREDFAEKVIKYLWDDVFKRNTATVIFKKGSGNGEFKSLSELIDAFENETLQGMEAFDKVFKLSVTEKVNLSKAYDEQQSDEP